MSLTGDEIEKAGNGLSKFLESLGKFFGMVQRYWKGGLAVLIVGVFMYQWHLIGTEYDKGYKTAKKEDDDYISTLRTNGDYKDKRILLLQKENDTLFKMWTDCKQTTYSNITIKTKQ